MPITEAQLKAIAKAVNGTSSPAGYRVKSEAEKRASVSKQMAKEAKITRWLKTEAGLHTLAANLANPVRYFLDFKGISRKFVVCEQIPESIPMYYDKDFEDIPAIVVGENGSSRYVVAQQNRVTLNEFEIGANPKIPYKLLYTLKFKPVSRTKDKLISGMQLQEDLTWFGMFEAAASIGAPYNAPVITTGALSKQDLAVTFARVEDRRLQVKNVLMSAYGIAGIRGWQFQDMDQVGMQEIRETGYLGSMWNADFWVSDQIDKGTVYTCTSPELFGWFPIRKDVEVIPANDPENYQLGFVGYELVGATLFNPYGICKNVFTSGV